MSKARLRASIDEKKIDAIFSDLNQSHLPGAAVGIAIAGKPVYRKGFGLASMDLPVVLSPSTRLRIASTSKHFTCLAYMLLCEDGRAAVDDPVGKYLPELHPLARPVTMRQLMTNTNGLRDVYDIFCQFEDHYARPGGAAQRVTSADLLTLYREIDDVNAEPGTTWMYNNGGWLILTAVIERITGEPIEQVMQNRIFGPAGMHDSLFLRSDMGFVPNRGSQHVLNPAGGFQRMSWGVDNFSGAGAVMSTVDDMLRWLANMRTFGVGSGNTWKLMQTPQSVANGTSTGYGLGLVSDSYRGVETLYHNGNAFGGSAQMLKVPGAELDIVILINRQDVLVLTDLILDACLPDLEPIGALADTSVADGTFCSPETGLVIQLSALHQPSGVIQSFAKGLQQLISIGGTALPARALAGNVLGVKSLWSIPKQTVTLIGDRKHPSAIRFDEFGNGQELTRSQAPARPPDLRAICGRYRYAPAGIDATITNSGDEARMLTAGRFGSAQFVLEPLAPGFWQARAAAASCAGFIGGALCFDDAGFRFSNSQTRALPFRRDHCR